MSYIRTYSKAKPTSRMSENDAFSELQQGILKKDIRRRALESIFEDESDTKVNRELTKGPRSRKMRVRSLRSKPCMLKSSELKPTPLKIVGRKIQPANYSPMVNSSPTQESDCLYLSDSSEESSTLLDEDLATVSTEIQDDDSIRCSDIELPRDLPDNPPKSGSKSSRILKLSDFSKKQAVKCKSHQRGVRKIRKPANSTLLEEKFSSMNIDRYGISNISGEGAEFLASDSSASQLSQDVSTVLVKNSMSRLVPVHKKTDSKCDKKPLERKTTSTATRSVYSLDSSDDTISLLQHDLTPKEVESGLKVAGKKLGLVKKNPMKEAPTSIHDRSTQSGKKQVSFILRTRPDLCDPSSPSVRTLSHVHQPRPSPARSILKKKSGKDLNLQPGKSSRATSTPKESSKHSRKTPGCHIMDQTLDISAVLLPSNNDMVISPECEEKENVDESQTEKQPPGLEALCSDACQNNRSCLETTPVKGDGSHDKGIEVTPCMQVKRSSPNAEAPSKQIAKKPRLNKQSRDNGPSNRKRLDLEETAFSADSIPECVITTAPFTGYREVLQPHPQQSPFVQGSYTQGPVDARQVHDFPQDILETLLDTVFFTSPSVMGSPC